MEELVQAALEARDRAFAPYSGFRVGAALRLSNGEICTGCNVENASYGLTICAERVAIFKAVSEGHLKFSELCVVADSPRTDSPMWRLPTDYLGVLRRYSHSHGEPAREAVGRHDE